MDSVRYCDRCDDFVWWCDTEKELIDAVERNRCVAFLKFGSWVGNTEAKLLIGKISFPSNNY
jgi:hypothetical protein